MRTQRIVSLVCGIVGIPLFPVSCVAGCLFALAAVPLLLALSIVWIVVFLGPLLALSWLWLRLPLLRVPLAVVGLPFAVLGYALVFVVPETPEDVDAKLSKLLLAIMWPYSAVMWEWDMSGRVASPAWGREFGAVLWREVRGVAPWRSYIESRGYGSYGLGSDVISWKPKDAAAMPVFRRASVTSVPASEELWSREYVLRFEDGTEEQQSYFWVLPWDADRFVHPALETCGGCGHGWVNHRRSGVRWPCAAMKQRETADELPERICSCADYAAST